MPGMVTGRWPRIGMIFGIPLAAFIGFCFVPVTEEVSRHSAVELAEPEIVHPETLGFVKDPLLNESPWK